jgi:hypothetical protein
VNPKSVSNILTGFPFLMQNTGAAAQFGLCFLSSERASFSIKKNAAISASNNIN